MDNLTWRNKCQDGKAWQRTKREEAAKNYEGREWWANADLNLKKARVERAPRSVVKRIILEYEWLGTLPPYQRGYGIFFDWACGGVTVFGGGANVYAHQMFGIEREELSYLARGACAHWTPKGTGSKLIALSLKQEAKLGKKVAIAYADTDAGEIGTLYQACNWLCIGKGKATQQMICPETGKVYDMKIVHDLRVQLGLRDVLSWTDMQQYMFNKGWTRQYSNPKWRYAYILAKGAERDQIYSNIEKFVVEYPKRHMRP